MRHRSDHGGDGRESGRRGVAIAGTQQLGKVAAKQPRGALRRAPSVVRAKRRDELRADVFEGRVRADLLEDGARDGGARVVSDVHQREVPPEIRVERLQIRRAGPNREARVEASVPKRTRIPILVALEQAAIALLHVTLGASRDPTRGPRAPTWPDLPGAEDLAKCAATRRAGAELHQPGTSRVRDRELTPRRLNPHHRLELREPASVLTHDLPNHRIPTIHHRLRGAKFWRRLLETLEGAILGLGERDRGVEGVIGDP